MRKLATSSVNRLFGMGGGGQAPNYYYLWYGTKYKRQYADKTLILRKTYVYASERSERA